jgi:hypothetical protein
LSRSRTFRLGQAPLAIFLVALMALVVMAASTAPLVVRAAAPSDPATDPGAVPASVRGEPGNAVARVEWEPPTASADMVITYRIYRWTGEATGDPEWVGSAWPFEREYLDYTVVNGQTYTYTVRAVYDGKVESKEANRTVVVPKTSDLRIVLAIDQKTATVNEEDVTLDAPAQMVKGRTMVPLRFVGTYLGASVDYDGTTRKITATLGDRVVVLWIDKTRALIDGKETTVSAPPTSIGGRTMVPIRFISEAFGAAVGFDGATGRVTVTMADKDATWDTATQFDVGQTVKAALNGSNDVDIYRIPITGAQSYRIWTSNVGPGCDTYLTVLSPEGTELVVNWSNDDATSDTRASETTVDYSVGPFLYFRIQSAKPGGANTSGNYSVSVARVTERNDTFASAIPLTPGTPYDATLHFPSDMDLYSFQLSPNQDYTIRTSNLAGLGPDGKPAESDTAIILWLDIYQRLWVLAKDDDSGLESGASEIRYQPLVQEPGTYYVSVYSYTGHPGPYTLTIEPVVPETDETYIQATPVVPDHDSPLRWLNSPQDQDWFKFEAIAGTRYYIQTVNLSAWCDTVLTLRGAGGGTVLLSNDDFPEAGSAVEWVAPADGTYYVKVTQFNPEEFLCLGAYRLCVTTAARERDNYYDFAVPLPLDGPAVSASLVENDVDSFVFEATRGLTYTVATADIEEGCATSLILVDEDGKLLAESAGNGPAGSVTWQATYTGKVYALVVAPEGSEDATGLYSVSLKTGKGPSY